MRKEDILAKCIDDIEAGESTLEECLARYPELRDELRPLLEMAQRLQPQDVAPSAEFKQQARSRLLEAMRSSPAPAKSSRVAVPGWLKVLVAVRRPSFAVTAMLILLLLAAGGGSAVYASQDSLPDDALYPVKKGVENVQLTITRNSEARAGLRSKLAQRRVEEIIAQANLGRSISDTAVWAIPANIDAALRDISSTSPEEARPFLTQLAQLTLNQEIRLSQVLSEAPERSHSQLKQAFDAVQRGNLIARVAYDNPTFLVSRPSALDDQLEAAYFEVKGTLLSADDGNWNVGGVTIKNVKSDSAPQRPAVGSQVQIVGVVQKDGTFISKIDSHEGTEGQVEVQGVLRGISSDEKVWYVGGVPIIKPHDATPPAVGSSMKVAGKVENDNLVVTSVRSEDDEDDKEDRAKVKVSGTLAGVNSGQNNIAVDVAGARVTVDTSKASIESSDGEPLKLSDLGNLVGKDVKVSQPYVVDGVLHAQKVSVDVNQIARSSEGDKGQRSNGDDDRRGSNLNPTPTQTPIPTSPATPTRVPTPTPRYTEKTGDNNDQGRTRPTYGQEDEERNGLKSTPTPVPDPTLRPSPTATPRYTEKTGDREEGNLKPTLTPVPNPTLRSSPTPTPRYTEKRGDN